MCRLPDTRRNIAEEKSTGAKTSGYNQIAARGRTGALTAKEAEHRLKKSNGRVGGPFN
jgi:hypothetical protein